MSLAQVSRLDWRRHHRKMEPQGNRKQTREKTSRTNRGHAYSSGLDLETKIFSASGRGGAFFLTSLFIELIDLGLRGDSECNGLIASTIQVSRIASILSPRDPNPEHHCCDLHRSLTIRYPSWLELKE